MSSIDGNIFANGMEHRARRAGRNVSIQYNGGGWFEVRERGIPPLISRVRRTELRTWVERLESLAFTAS